MARKVERVKVDDQEYVITGLKTTDGLAVYDELLRTLGPTVSAAVAARAGDAASLSDPRFLEKVALEVLLRGIGALPKDILTRLGARFAAHSKVVASTGPTEMLVELNEGMYEEHFSCRMGHWTRWVMACLKVNFSDFIPSSSGGTPTSSAAIHAG